MIFFLLSFYMFWHLPGSHNLSEKPVNKIKLLFYVTFFAFLSAINDIKFVEQHVWMRQSNRNDKED